MKGTPDGYLVVSSLETCRRELESEIREIIADIQQCQIFVQKYGMEAFGGPLAQLKDLREDKEVRLKDVNGQLGRCGDSLRDGRKLLRTLDTIDDSDMAAHRVHQSMLPPHHGSPMTASIQVPTNPSESSILQGTLQHAQSKQPYASQYQGNTHQFNQPAAKPPPAPSAPSPTQQIPTRAAHTPVHMSPADASYVQQQQLQQQQQQQRQ
eukprot:GFYU01010913.1.p1 GENE.GFYU01010913.1~~GFYU01010913.1.p1  ORF type:complete len:209 (-),score=36.31 GFYU01010913.1:16-642(-)